MIEHRLPGGQGRLFDRRIGGRHPGRLGRQVVACLGIDRIEHLADRQQSLGGAFGLGIGVWGGSSASTARNSASA